MAKGPPCPYIGAMPRMSRKSRFNLGTGIVDFWGEFRKPTPYRWPILGVSGLLTFGLLYGVTTEKYYYPPARPTIEYITSFEEGRSDAEIAASNEENQRRQDAIAAELEEFEERKRELYRSLGRSTGMDVDAMERQIAEDRAAEEAEVEQLREQRQERSDQASEQ